MRTTRTVAISLRNLAHHAFRSLLTALGVIFGVAAVVAMMAVSEGARIEALRDIAALGIDTIVVQSVKPTAGASAGQDSGFSVLEYGVTDHDIHHIETVFDNVREIVPVRNLRQSVYAEGKRTDVRVFGTTPRFFSLTHTVSADARGRLLTVLDGDRTQPVCVIGQRAARTLFAFRDPLGRTLQVGGGAFRIVGLVRNPHSLKVGGTYDINNAVFVPQQSADAVYGKTVRQQTAGSFESTKVEADFLYISIADVDQIANTSARLRTYLLQSHPRGDTEVQVPYEQMQLMEATKRRAAIVLASIAAISLLVGGIGIMNIMMANVYERIREIGTRRALGARRRDILLQFLVESMLLTSLGGLCGVALGIGMAALVTRYFSMETDVTQFSVLISLAVSVLTGILFGTYPAWKAANIDPIQALRSE